ncbi:MAG: hypothetical protein ACLFQJ_07800 [Campylobacterales bacterium]
MQTFPYMQRSFSYKEVVSAALALIFLTIYESISSIFYLLPPLLGVALYLFIDFLEKREYFRVGVIALFLLILEADKGFIFGTTIVFFLLVYFFLLPFVNKLIGSPVFYKLIIVSVAYTGYTLFLVFIEYILRMPLFDFSYILLYYIVLETLLVVFFL